MRVLDRPSTNGHVSSVTLTPPRRRSRWWFAALAALVVVAILASLIVVRARAGAVTYTTVPATQGSLAQTVTASGTLNPQNTISVGTQVSGTISEIDTDFNAHVRKGQVLAKLDPTTFQAQLDQAESTLAQSQAQAQAAGATASGAPSAIAASQAQAAASAASARAAQQTAAAARVAVASAQANVTKSQSALVLAQQTVARDRALIGQGYIAQNQVDADQSNLVAAQTALQSAQAAVQQAQAQADASVAQAASASATQQASGDQAGVADATAANQSALHDASVAAIGIQQANVAVAKANLAHTIITSPVDGTVIARSVSIGQTVAASLQTPTLFTIAQDLGKMELDLAVGEPDIGRVRAGDPVDFTVLAYPNRTFHATVEQVRQNPTTVSNVVTYTSVVIVDNQDGALRPGMTANATIQVAHVDDATIVPLAAFSYQPPAGSFGGAHRGHRNGAAGGANATTAAKPAGTGAASTASPWGATSAASGGAVTSGGRGRIFVLRGGKPVVVPVTVGLVGETQASVSPLRGTLGASDGVIVGDSSSSSGSHAAGGGNPLAGGQQRGGPGGSSRSALGGAR